MTTYAQILLYGVPFFLVLIAIEYFYSVKKDQEVYGLFDTISSLSSGMTNTLKDVLGLSVVIVSYTYLYKNFAVQQLESSIIMYVVAFVALDFSGYWGHRLEHKINFLWNRHIIHHSSEEFNLACALRQSISAVFRLFTIFLLPAAILGVPPKVISVVAPLHLFAQFWYHTKLIDRMGFLEWIIVTPSHHRVHHAINDLYIDKNFGQIFIFWDRMFGTFQEEMNDEVPVYGIKKAAATWNPLLINFMHLWQIAKDSWRASSWVDKVRVWFMPTGWRPSDVASKYPVSYTEDPATQVKYQTKYTSTASTMVLVLFASSFVTMLVFFATIADYSLSEMLTFGVGMTGVIFGYTSLMDGSTLSYLGWLVSITATVVLAIGSSSILVFLLFAIIVIGVGSTLYLLRSSQIKSVDNYSIA